MPGRSRGGVGGGRRDPGCAATSRRAAACQPRLGIHLGDPFAFAGNEPLEAVLEPGYFDWCSGRLRPGALFLWGCNPDRSSPRAIGEPRAIHRALLM